MTATYSTYQEKDDAIRKVMAGRGWINKAELESDIKAIIGTYSPWDGIARRMRKLGVQKRHLRENKYQYRLQA